jgi:Dolichyl-phosphate-mannose-protein mannosyltransferase
MSLTVQSWRMLRASVGARPLAAGRPEGAVARERRGGARRVRWPLVALAGLVVVAVVGRFIASLGLDTPWFAPDEMAYALLGRSFWLTGHSQYLDGKTTFLGAYSFLAGAPLAAFGPGTGLLVLKGLQALLVAVPVVTVYLWARGLARERWALAAAAMTAALPAFVYSGLIMTEVVFLAVVTLLLWQLWRTLLDPSLRNQLLVLVGTSAAVAIRLKAFVLLPSIVITVLLMAWFSRDRGFLRRFAPLAVVLAAGFTAAAAVALGARPGLLGPYALALERGYNTSAVVHWIAYTAADLLLLVVVVPVFAALVFAVASFRGRADEPVRALIALLLPYTVLLVVEMGAYVSRFDQRLIERSLITLAPPLFIALAAWLERGMPRPRSAVVLALVLLAPAFFWPTGTVVTSNAVTDSFTTIPLFDLRIHTSVHELQLAWTALLALALLLAVLLPRRLGLLLALAVIGCLLTASVLAQSKIAGRAARDRQHFFGTSSPGWIDHAASGSVVYLDNDPLWAASWHLTYWNPKISLVTTVRPPTGQRPDDATAAPQDNGELLDQNGQPLTQHLVLAPSTMTLAGRRLAHHPQGPDEPGLDLWATPGPPRLLTWTNGALPGAQIGDTVKFTTYACRPGSLELTLLAQDGPARVDVSVDPLTSVQVLIRPGAARKLWIPTPKGANGRGTCVYYISPIGTLVAKTMAFRPGASTIPSGVPVHRAASAATEVATRSPVTLSRTPAGSTYSIQVGYCLDGQFLQLDYNQARQDPAYKRAVYANFIAGEGITCAQPPPGYTRQGFATDGVPPGIYPYYAPAPSGSTTATTTTAG